MLIYKEILSLLVVQLAFFLLGRATKEMNVRLGLIQAIN